MKFSDYAIQARVTATYGGRHAEKGLAYATLGLVGEATEVLEAQHVNADPALVLAELGDVTWYAVACVDELGADIDALEDAVAQLAVAPYPDWANNAGSIAVDVAVSAGRASETVKKALGKNEYRHGEPRMDLRLPADRRAQVIVALIQTLAAVQRLVELHGGTLDGVLAANIAKLQGRQQAGTLLGGNREGEQV